MIIDTDSLRTLCTDETIIVCAFCKGEYENGFTTYAVTLGDSVIVVKNVPCLMCNQCGEVSYIGSVYNRLEQIIGALRDSVTEVAIIKYTAVA